MALALGLVSVAPAAVSAQELCVVCSGPDVTYQCSVKDADKISQFRGAGKVLDYVCITELARTGGHQKCRVSRDFVGSCLGQPRVLDFSRLQDVPQQSPPQPAEASQPDDAAKAAAAQPQPKGPPRTLEELTRESLKNSQQQMVETDQKLKNAAKSAGDGIGKAGNAVGTAFKNGFECVITLFKECKGNESK